MVVDHRLNGSSIPVNGDLVPMEKAKFRPHTTSEPLNRLEYNLAQLIKSRKFASKRNLRTRRSAGSSGEM